jgi:hypothetical protein
VIEGDTLKGLNRIGLKLATCDVIKGDKITGLHGIGLKLATCDRRR